VQPVGAPTVVAADLDAPWSILRLPDGATIISERDTGDVLELLADGSTRVAAEVPGVDAAGEGGLLGLAYLAEGDGGWVYAYLTASDDNRIVRMPLTGAPGALALGAPQDVLTGLAKAGNHNGGRIAFGPDGMLYATVGDAGQADAAQNPDALNGKILRMTPTGAVPEGNPFGTLVWSMGHRNPQGIAWDSHGRLWASEFGQNTWDELNLIEAGGNYGWPVVEGAAGDSRFVDPVRQWATADASPSGLAIISDTLFMASLRGERIWTIDPDTTRDPVAWFAGEYGRIRDVAAGADGSLWFISNNTDGRGDPQQGDDKLYQVGLGPAS
jgi:glucose/arabinose dehydrogenase